MSHIWINNDWVPVAKVVDELERLRVALQLIGTECQNYTGDSTCAGSGRSPYAYYGADRWCEGCQARTALRGEPLPAHGVSGVLELPAVPSAASPQGN